MFCCDNFFDFICNELVNRILDCGYSKDFFCYVKVKFYKCKVLMKKIFLCEYEVDMYCWKSLIF